MIASHVGKNMPKNRVLFGKGHIRYKEENFQVGLKQDCKQASVGAARGSTVLAQACECIARLLKMSVLHRHLLHYCPMNTNNDMPNYFEMLMPQPCS